MEFFNPFGDGSCDHCRRQLARRRQHPIALFVEFTDDAGAHVFAPVIQLFFELVFDHAALFFDHQNFFQAFGEVARTFTLQRPRHRHFEQADTDFGGVFLIDAEVIQRLQNVHVGFAGSTDAESWFWAVQGDVVQVVGAGKRQRCINFVTVQAFFLIQRRVRPANVQTAVGHLKIGGQFEVHHVRRDVDGG